MTADPHLHDDETSVPEDDAVIGRVFRWSIGVMALVAVVIVVLLQMMKSDDAPPPTEQEEIVGPGAVVEAEDAPAVRFTDVTTTAGIDFVHYSGAVGGKYLPETMGAGCAFFDYDGDDDQDLFLANGTAWPWDAADGSRQSHPHALYRNDGTGRFVNVTEAAGLGLDRYSMGVAVGDYDADGDVDLFLTGVGGNRLFANHEGVFEDVTAKAGVAGPTDAWTTSAGFHDLDGDGRLDLFVCTYVKWSREIDEAQNYTLKGVGRAYGPPANFEGAHCFLYRNQGGGVFEDVSEVAGIQVKSRTTGDPVGKSLGVRFCDFDADGDTDVFVANDTVRNFLFRNEGDWKFRELGELAGVAYDSRGAATGAMGVDVADVRADGAFGVAVGNFASEMSSLYLSRRGRMQFTDAAISEGVGAPSRQALSFGLFFFDYDLDGRPDLFQTNGHLEEEINKVQPSQHYEQESQLFWNAGSHARAVYALVDPKTTGDLSRPVVGRACAFADIDGDGDQDVLITQVGRAPLLLRNDQALGHHWMRLVLRPKQGSPIGTRVRVTAGGQTFEQVVAPTRSYLSQVESTLTFGLARTAKVDRIEVEWPDGTIQELAGGLPVDKQIILGGQ